MKLPSLQQVFQESGRTLRRFPFVLLSAALGTAAAIILIDREGVSDPTPLYGILLASALGVSLLTALALVAEKRRWGRVPSMGLQIAGILLLAAYGTTVPMNLHDAAAIHIFRFLMFGAALHFLVAFAPFSWRGESTGFWYYNKSLFLRLFTAGLFTAVLFAGLALALAALDNLFGMEVPGKRYGELWVFLVGLFATWFFLAGVPEDLAELDAGTEYPKGLRIFAQYILSPIVAVYFVILYAYLAKILFTWAWPKGWVSGLILGFSTAGILSLILLYPLRERTDSRWIKKASGWFVVIMIPLIVMLFLAVWRRISEYGVTEGRYIVCLIGVWLAVMAAYFIVSKGKSIKIIPASLCLFSFLAAFGPWGAFAVSEGSQVARLESLLTKNTILVDGKVHKGEKAIPFEETKEISSILWYLNEIHGFERIQPWFNESLTEDTSGGGSERKTPAAVAEMLGIDLVAPGSRAARQGHSLVADGEGDLSIGGYDRMVRGVTIDTSQLEWTHPDGLLSIHANQGLDILTVVPDRGRGDSLRIELRPLFDVLLKRNPEKKGIPPEEMSVVAVGGGMQAKVYFRRIGLLRREEAIEATGYNVDLLFRVLSR